MNLDEVLSRLDVLPPEKRAEIERQVKTLSGERRFWPSPGPQTEAWFSPADVLLYGGEAGGGKSGLVCGLALEEHRNSLLMRRRYVDLQGGGGLIDDLLRLHGTRRGFNGASPPTLRTTDGRVITFGAASNLGDEQAFQGRPRDFLGIDEATQFLEAQVRFLLGWVRTIVEGQRCRAVLATNPPLSAEGDWVVGMFRPWLDMTHPNPAEQGELRWFVTSPDGDDVEVDGPEPVEMDGHTLRPTSRTFIRAKLSDNPFIVQEDYASRLDALPEPLRSAVRDGNFMANRQDHDFQVIPSSWVRAAMDRWEPRRPEHAPMSAIAADVAQGGADATVIATRHDAWFGELHKVRGVDTPTGSEVAALILARRRNMANVVIDMGGGWGGGALMRLQDNGVQDITKFVGAASTGLRTKDQALKFRNVRAAAYWRLREALDPDQDGGSPIALPDDPELMGDLTAARYEVTANGIKIEDKADIAERLGRSPDEGDAVVMCWWGGPRFVTHGEMWRKAIQGAQPGRSVNVVMGREAARRRR